MRTIDTGTDHLRAEVDDGVAVLTMNRPERRNAMSGEMLVGLQRALEDAELARDVRCVVLTGAGGGFCAGGDVKGFAEGSARGGPTTFDEKVHAQRVQQRATAGVLWKLPKPTLAVLPGPAAGAGLSLALACDLRVAVEGTVLTTAFAKVGFSGDFGGSWFLTQLVGAAKARELYFLSDRVDADDALRLGLLNQVLPADGFEEGWRALARRLADGPTIAYRYMKENINRAMTEDLVECMDMEALHHLHCGGTEDHLEASKAFVEKRTPTFHGR
jgi:2-(1,2-epoxy-1,2-dihydrophenyl)acetyl-CoA isomerase